jgi:hypothetical protein
MELEKLVPGMIGAFVGVIGWLFEGIYIQRRQVARSTMLFAPTFVAPDWREPYREPLEHEARDA